MEREEKKCEHLDTAFNPWMMWCIDCNKIISYTPSPDLLEKARREAEEVDVWKLRTESEALEASSFTLDDWEEIEGFAIEVYKKAYIKGRLKTN